MFKGEPGVLIIVGALAAAYVVGALKAKRRVTARQAIAFAAALAIILFSLTGPLERLEQERLFTAHMIQNLLLTMIVPPLLLLGLPDWMLRPMLCNRLVKPAARLVTSPVIAVIIFSLTFCFAHLPTIYDLMCRDPGVHAAFRVAFVVSGVILWWPLLSTLPELPRMSYAGQIMYLFVFLIPMTAVAAPITLAAHLVYPWYAKGPHPWGLTPMADQVLGGILMWVGQSFYILLVFTAVFFRWSRRDDVEMPPMDTLHHGASLKVASPSHPLSN